MSAGPVTLHCYVVPSNGETIPADGPERVVLLCGLFKGTIRTKPEEGTELQGSIAPAEASLTDTLRRITRQEFDQGARFAAVPLFDGIVGGPSKD